MSWLYQMLEKGQSVLKITPHRIYTFLISFDVGEDEMERG